MAEARHSLNSNCTVDKSQSQQNRSFSKPCLVVWCFVLENASRHRWLYVKLLILDNSHQQIANLKLWLLTKPDSNRLLAE
ncbi:hypothetical protein T03_4293 [Trichinella britovi]|uniref:Uncharacterized protein n=1 Tax=Trichinella britovi TaxID=45882 RepID=A0A0V1CGX0_TRIBR|nr:hypothetical protein T03_4293 [Trichinella britovi]KRZ82650.1 hypothetical protein T08_7519 [Trichinella sp. T8]